MQGNGVCRVSMLEPEEMGRRTFEGLRFQHRSELEDTPFKRAELHERIQRILGERVDNPDVVFQDDDGAPTFPTRVADRFDMRQRTAVLAVFVPEPAHARYTIVEFVAFQLCQGSLQSVLTVI